MQHISGWVENGDTQVSVSGLLSTTLVQKSFPLSTVTVYLAGTTTPALIYSDSVGTAMGNPFTANANGTWSFYAQAGLFDVVFSGTGITAPFTLPGLGNSISTFLGPAYVSAADYPGSDFGAQVSAAIAALPATGGTVDTRAFVGTQTINSTVVVDRAVVLILGKFTVVVSASIGFSATAGFQVRGAGRASSIFQQATTTGTIFSMATVDACSVQDITIQSGSHQTAGAGIVITGNGSTANNISLIFNNTFSGQWIAIDQGQCIKMQTIFNQIQDGRFRGIRINNTVNGDEGNNLIQGNNFSSDVALTGNFAIELIAGGGLKISTNQFQTWDIAIAVNWNTPASSSQLSIVDNFCEAQKTAIIKMSRTAGALSGILIADNFLTSDVFPGTQIWFATNGSIWTSDVSISDNIMNVGSAAIGVLMEGGGVGDQAIIDGNLIFGSGTSTGVKVGSGYGQLNFGINSISVGSGGAYVISSGFRGTYLPDKIGIGVTQAIALTQRVLIPNNEFYAARDSTGTLQSPLIGLDPSNNVILGQDQNATVVMAGPMRFGVGLDAHSAQFNTSRIYTPTLTPASKAGGSTSEEVFTVAGITANDMIVIQGPPPTNALGICGWRVGTNLVAISWTNPTGGALTPPSGVYKILAFTAFSV